VKDYLELLSRVDAWYAEVKRSAGEKLPCAKGCRDCCLGLFDVTLADGELLREGLRAAAPEVRRDVQARADAILERLRETFPDLGEDLDGWGEADVDEVCDRLGDVECPALGPAGDCRLYAHRPMTCRLCGPPLVDRSGAVVHPEGCPKCLLPAAEAPALDCEGLRRDERRLLRKRHPGRSGVVLLIPQALATERSPAGS
jgi:Fe-S-cluster containining protein